MKLKYYWLDRRYYARKHYEAVIRWIVWRLPREVIKWAFVRVGAHATTGRFGDTIVPEITMMEALGRWDSDNTVAKIRRNRGIKA